MRMFKRVMFWLLILLAIIGVTVTFFGWWFSSPISRPEQARIVKADHFTDGAFKNPEPQAAFEFSWAEMKIALFGDERQTSPIGTIPIVTPDPAFMDTPAASGLRFMWLGHAAVLLEVDGVRILLDPALSERVSPFSFAGPKRFHPSPLPIEALRGIDVALISHNHYDHLDEATVRHLAKQGTKLFVPLGMRTLMRNWGVPDEAAQSFDWNAEASIKGVRFIATPTRHYSNRGMLDYKKTSWNSWTIVGPKHRVFFSGDTGYSKNFAKIGEAYGPFDLGVIKVGAYGPGQAWQDIHMVPEDAVQTAQDIGAKVMLPVHWGTFNLAYHAWDEPADRVLKNAQGVTLDFEGAEFRLTMPKPGEMIDIDNMPVLRTWWRDVD